MTNVQQITPELRRWIVAQAQAGHPPEAVLGAMKASGWREDVAIQAMEQTLDEFLAERRQQASAGGMPLQMEPLDTGTEVQHAAAATRAAAAPLLLDPAAAMPVDKPLPEPDLTGAPAVVRAGDRDVQVLMSAKHPRVVVFGGLLSADECKQIINLARARLKRSETVDNATGGSEVNAARTSRGMFFDRGENAVVSRVEQRIAALLRWPVDHGEGLQVLHYQPGAEYKPHHDYFDPAHPGSAPILRRGGQRVGTLVMYLNTPRRGGGTTFPDAGLEVAAVQGNAVFFSYDRPHVSTRTLHGGAPVGEGEKWVATKWLREGVFS